MKSIPMIGLLLASFLLNAQAQAPSLAPDAPVPQAILDAKTVFISNAMPIISNLSGGPNRGYNRFYAAMKAMERYEVVNDPSNADLVFELQAAPFGTTGSDLDGVLLLIYDRKTHFVLWTLAHPIGTCALKRGCDKNFDTAIDSLIRDLKALCRQSPSPTAP